MPQAPHSLQCFEIWGGNDIVDRAVSMPGLDAWVLSKPHGGDASGGDIHYLSSCATGRIGRVLLADVSGHGASVSDFAVRLRGLMRQFVNYVDHTKLVEKLNQEFALVASPGMFATAAVLTWWAPTGDVDISSAGHPPALIFDCKLRTWRTLDMPERPSMQISDAPFGILDTTYYQRTKLRLHAGDMLLLYSDAMIEARREDDSELGVQGLLALANSMPDTSPESVVTKLLTLASRGLTLQDDATLLLVRRNETPVPKAGIVGGLASTLRIAREAARDLLRGNKAALPEARMDNIAGAYFDKLNKRK